MEQSVSFRVRNLNLQGAGILSTHLINHFHCTINTLMQRMHTQALFINPSLLSIREQMNPFILLCLSKQHELISDIGLVPLVGRGLFCIFKPA